MKAEFGFGKQYRITKTDEYSSVFRLRCSVFSPHFQVYGKANGLGRARIGLVVGKKVAHRAVSRNYMKRTLREFFRLTRSNYSSLDMVVLVRKRFGRSERQDVLGELASIIHKLQVKCAD